MKLNKFRILLLILSLAVIYVNSTATESNSKNAIFGSFKMSVNKNGKVDLTLKTKNKIKEKKSTLSPPATITLGDVVPHNLLQPIQEEIDPVMTNISLGEPPYFSGWVQYFKYTTDQGLKKPSAFFKNMQFETQMRQNATLNLSEIDSDKQFKYIHKDTYFYATLFDSTLNIANSKKNRLALNYDVVNLQLISPVAEDIRYRGGIEDFGNFAEGYCFKIKTESNQNIIWIICNQNVEEKKKLMGFLKKLKLKQQREEGKIVTDSSLKQEPNPLEHILNPSKALERRKIAEAQKNTKPLDGYWIVLQDWSQCSLKCGGGQTVLHRMCVPPKAGGNPCIGQGILRKPCNTDPCPKVSEISGATSTHNITEILEPSVRVMQFSNRPQRYIKCIVKESDLLYTIDVTKREGLDENRKHKYLSIPARVVMNNKTLSIFAGEDYNSLKDSYDLSRSDFHPSARSTFCFIISDETKKGEFCFFGADRSIDNYNQWDYDFNLFKHQCHSSRPIANLTDDDLKDIDKQVDQEKQNMLIDQEIKVIHRSKEKDVDEKENDLVNSNKIALMAVQKQINLEALIEKEEQEREQDEIIKLRRKIEEEKEKHECAMKRIKEKEIENQYNLRAEEVDEESAEIRKKAAEDVIINRNKLKEKIRNMRKAAKREQSKLKQELRSVRLKFNSDMVNAYKKGNQDHCIAVILSRENYKNYCLRMFPNDPETFGRCTESDNPCHTCCENEFNEMFYNERMKCVKQVCLVDHHIHGGKWVWEPDIMDDK